MKTSSREIKKKQKEVLIFEYPYTLTQFLYKRFLQLAEESVRERGRFVVALAGGRTPVEFYCKLSGYNDFELWRKTFIFMTDERWVEMDDPKSNYRMLQEALFNYLPLPPGNIHPIFTDYPDAVEGAARYEEDLMDFFKLKPGQLPVFDAVLLGIGEDGHTASIFHQKKTQSEPAGLACRSYDWENKERITLTLPVLNHARWAAFMVCGDNKASIIRQILVDKLNCPAARIDPVEGELLYLLDKTAAQQLPYREAFEHCGDAISLKI